MGVHNGGGGTLIIFVAIIDVVIIIIGGGIEIRGCATTSVVINTLRVLDIQ